MPPTTYYTIEELLLRHGVEPESARYIAMNALRDWEVRDISSIFAKVRRPERDFCPFHDPSRYLYLQWPKKKEPFDEWETYFRGAWPSFWADDEKWVSAPRDMMLESVEKKAALCLNEKGQWSLQTEKYVAISHVWSEGLQRDKVHQGVLQNRVDLMFKTLRKSKIEVEWVWVDSLSIPSGGGATDGLKDDLLCIDIINILPDVYSNAEAIVIFDALVWQLHSDDPIDIAVALTCGRWVSRVWTFQECEMADKAYIITGTGHAALFSEITQKLKEKQDEDPDRFRKLWYLFASISKDDTVDIDISDIASTCQRRVSGLDVDYARAFFPTLGLKWEHGMTREQGMQKIFRSQLLGSPRLLFTFGHPRMKIRPAWAPSYITGLEGRLIYTMERELRGLRASLLVTRIVSIQKHFVRFGKRVMDLELDGGKLQCFLAEDESEEVFKNVQNMVTAGRAYVINMEKSATETEFSSVILLAEKAEVDESDGFEVALHCTARQTSTDSYESVQLSVLIRHASPLDQGRDFDNRWQYMKYRQKENSRSSNIPREEGESQLHAAVRVGDLSFVNTLLSQGQSVDELDIRGRSPLHVAAVRGQLDILRVLIPHTKDIDLQSEELSNNSALSLAAEAGQAESIRVLVEHGANIESRNKYESTPLMIAAYEGKLAAVETLIFLGAAVEATNKSGYSGTPLHMTCGRTLQEAEGVGIVRALLDAGANVDGHDHPVGWTPLHEAIEWAHISVIKLLIARGADINAPEKVRRWTLLRKAVSLGKREIVELLLDAGANCRIVFDENWTTLHWAAQSADFEIMRMVIQHPVELDIQAGPKKRTALHGAANKGRAIIVKMLVEAGADVNVLDADGKTAEQLAKGCGADEIAEYLARNLET